MRSLLMCPKTPIPLALTLCVLVSSFVLPAKSTSADEVDVWIGTSRNHGIYHLTLNTDSGKMSTPTRAAELKGAGFQVLSPDGKTLYSSGSRSGEAPGVAAYTIENGTLEFINSLPTGDGGATCVNVDRTGNVLMTAQYGGGSMATFTLKPDGSLGDRVELIEHGPGSGVHGDQKESHPHWIGASPDNRFVMVPDLGQDRVVVYALDPESARVQPHAKIAVPPGSGPRHMKFHPSGKFVYVLNELTLTVSVFEFDGTHAGFQEIQLIEALPEELRDRHHHSAAEIRIHPSGRFVYTSNRGHDSISVFLVDLATGKLTFVQREAIRGSWPRNFDIDPTGKWLLAAGAFSNTLSLFEIDQKTGELTFTRKIVNVPSPICVTFSK